MIFLTFICIHSESGDFKEIDLPKLNFENGENRTEYFPFKKVSCTSITSCGRVCCP